MKLSLSLIMVCMLGSMSYAQPSLVPTKDLTDSFTVIYQQTDKTTNFFSRLLTTSQAFFHPENKFLNREISSLMKKEKINTDSSINFIYNNVLNNYIQNYAWNEFPQMLEENRDMYILYNTKVCPCLSNKIKNSSKKGLQQNDMNDCVTPLIQDTSYINAIRRATGSKTMDEVYKASQYALLFTMQHCSVLTNYFLDIIKENSIYNYSYIVMRKFESADNEIAELYKKGNNAALLSIFPDYKKFIQPIKQVSDFFNKSGMSSILPKKETSSAGVVTFTKTYYKYVNKQPVLSCQVIYTVKEAIPDAPILSFIFFSADKIPNKVAIMKELNSDEGIALPPPPPQEWIKEVPKKQ